MSVQEGQPRISSREESATAHCPFDHSALAPQKTARVPYQPECPVESGEDGTWHIRGFNEARALLRSGDTEQAGFGANFIKNIPGTTNTPILYLEGKTHHQQRKQTARFFAPKVVSDNYRPLMERLVAQMLEEAKSKRRFDLSHVSRMLAVRVAGEVVGLTDSVVPGMDKRLESFFHGQGETSGAGILKKLKTLFNQRKILSFLYFDVKPAIRARRRKLQEDVISYLVAQNYNEREILTECVTYAAAGMVTTREFISVATWHFLEKPGMQARYLVAPEKERYEMLAEVLRLEPVVSHLARYASNEIKLKDGEQTHVIPQGAKIDINIYGTNQDERIVGEHSDMLYLGRELCGDHVPHELMSFGDGHHRCPGSYIAIQETDILLHKLLALDGLHIVRKPDVTWNDFTNSYELRNFMLAVD